MPMDYCLCLGMLKYGCASSVYGKICFCIAMGGCVQKTPSVDGVLLLAYRNVNNLKNT